MQEQLVLKRYEAAVKSGQAAAEAAWDSGEGLYKWRTQCRDRKEAWAKQSRTYKAAHKDEKPEAWLAWQRRCKVNHETANRHIGVYLRTGKDKSKIAGRSIDQIRRPEAEEDWGCEPIYSTQVVVAKEKLNLLPARGNAHVRVLPGTHLRCEEGNILVILDGPNEGLRVKAEPVHESSLEECPGWRTPKSKEEDDEAAKPLYYVVRRAVKVKRQSDGEILTLVPGNRFDMEGPILKVKTGDHAGETARLPVPLKAWLDGGSVKAVWSEPAGTKAVMERQPTGHNKSAPVATAPSSPGATEPEPAKEPVYPHGTMLVLGQDRWFDMALGEEERELMADERLLHLEDRIAMVCGGRWQGIKVRLKLEDYDYLAPAEEGPLDAAIAMLNEAAAAMGELADLSAEQFDWLYGAFERVVKALDKVRPPQRKRTTGGKPKLGVVG
jgi:hypothetical protein